MEIEAIYENSYFVFLLPFFSAKTPGLDDANKIMKHRVTMVGWSLYDTHVITAVNDHSLRVWDSRSGKLVQEFIVSRFWILLVWGGAIGRGTQIHK